MPYQPPSERMVRGRGAMSATPPGQLEGGGEDAYDESAAPAKDEGEGGQPTADIPMALLGGKEFKPGEEIVFKIVSIDQASKMAKIAYATGEDDEKGGDMGDEHPTVAAMPGGDEKGY